MLLVYVMLQASTDQTNVDIFIPFMIGLVAAMYTTLLSIFIVTCQYAWPTVFFVIPLAWLNIWYRVSVAKEIILFAYDCFVETSHWYFFGSNRDITLHHLGN